SEHRSIDRIVANGSTPDFEKHVERQLLGGFAIAAQARGQREHEAVRSLVESMQRDLIAGGDGANELDPLAFGSQRLRAASVKDVAERRGTHVAIGHRLRLAIRRAAFPYVVDDRTIRHGGIELRDRTRSEPAPSRSETITTPDPHSCDGREHQMKCCGNCSGSNDGTTVDEDKSHATRHPSYVSIKRAVHREDGSRRRS